MKTSVTRSLVVAATALGGIATGTSFDKSIVQLSEGVVRPTLLDLLIGQVLPRGRAQAVDASAPRELADPGANGLVAPKRVQPLVRAGEDLLEDVLGVRGRKPEDLRRNGIDVA